MVRSGLEARVRLLFERKAVFYLFFLNAYLFRWRECFRVERWGEGWDIVGDNGLRLFVVVREEIVGTGW